MLQRILSIIGWLGTVIVFAAFGIRLFRPQWDQYGVYAAWAGLACVLIYTAGQWRDIFKVMKQRNARYGAIASVSVLVVLGILIAVNMLSVRRSKRWDLTANQQYSLSEQSIKLLRELDAPVKFLVFDQADGFDRFRTRLTAYQYQSPDNVQIEYIDADKRPVQAKQYNVDAYGTVVIEYKGRQERVSSDSEQDLTNGLIKAVTGQQKLVYFVQGHGEKDTANSERGGYSTIAGALGRDNYGVEKLVLAQQQDVPADAAVVVLAGPTVDLLAPEADMMRRYLEKGGHALILLDPPGAASAPTPMIDALLKDWSVEAGRNIVIDASGVGQIFGGDASVPVAASYTDHPITQRFNMLTAYPLARSVTPSSTTTQGRYAQTIIETGPKSWADTDLKASGEMAMDAAAGDKPGPVSVAVAVAAPVADAAAAGQTPPADPAAAQAADQTPKKESRLAVVGDSDFAANYAIGIQGNKDLFVNAVNWLAQQENLIAIRPREPDDRRITLTEQSTQGIFLMSLFIVPGLIFGAGVYSWWRRR